MKVSGGAADPDGVLYPGRALAPDRVLDPGGPSHPASSRPQTRGWSRVVGPALGAVIMAVHFARPELSKCHAVHRVRQYQSRPEACCQVPHPGSSEGKSSFEVQSAVLSVKSISNPLRKGYILGSWSYCGCSTALELCMEWIHLPKVTLKTGCLWVCLSVCVQAGSRQALSTFPWVPGVHDFTGYASCWSMTGSVPSWY